MNQILARFVVRYASGNQTHPASGRAQIVGILNIFTMPAAWFGILLPLAGDVPVAGISGVGHRV